jgi:excisionase family DNA binding protein
MEKESTTQTRLAVSVAEAATMLGISRRTVEGYIRIRRLPARKLGRRTVVLVRDLENFLRRDQPHASGTHRASASPGSAS